MGVSVELRDPHWNNLIVFSKMLRADSLEPELSAGPHNTGMYVRGRYIHSIYMRVRQIRTGLHVLDQSD